MYDAVKRAVETAKIVSRGDARKYYRFRSARFYGGISTADCVGCNLSCIFCWSWENVMNPETTGNFYTPQQVAEKLVKTARKKGYRRVRISGNEPTLVRDHLLEVIRLIPPDILFILETNGILIGHDPTYADDLAQNENLFVRVSLKGTNQTEFFQLTGAEPIGFDLQVKALEHLLKAGVQAQPAAMISFSPYRNVTALQQRLAKLSSQYAEIETEEVMYYGKVEERLRKFNRREDK